MAEICTRVCPSDRLCEQSCVLSGVSEPVSIRALEQFLIDYAFNHQQIDTSTAGPNGMKVAVVGAGPGGLVCAEELARRGYSVTIFDSALIPGGLLVNGVPAFRLEHSIVERRIQILKQLGVTFRLPVNLWKEVSLTDLRHDFDAVYLGFDSREARGIDAPGSHLSNVVQAVPFLLQKNTPLPLQFPSLELHGKSVVVLGGGDTAMDCLRAAIRYGAREVICAYRRDESDMPCGRQEYKAALEEGARFLFRVAPIAFHGTPDGVVKEVCFVRTEPAGQSSAQGRRDFKAILSEQIALGADFVILALGFEPVPCPATEGFQELERKSNGCVFVDDNQMTSLPGLFAGGDLVTGPTTLIYAVRDARRAAERMHIYLTQRQHSGSAKAHA
jgi:glutamate synthase (NADPH/NADH) small chain